MPDCTALSIIDSNPLALPEVDLGILPARLSKRLWITPTEFLQTTNAMATAAWAVRVSQSLTRRLPDPERRGPKMKYGENSILMMAFIQVYRARSQIAVLRIKNIEPQSTPRTLRKPFKKPSRALRS